MTLTFSNSAVPPASDTLHIAGAYARLKFRRAFIHGAQAWREIVLAGDPASKPRSFTVELALRYLKVTETGKNTNRWLIEIYTGEGRNKDSKGCFGGECVARTTLPMSPAEALQGLSEVAAPNQLAAIRFALGLNPPAAAPAATL